jgi:tetratricopeptide (TPR) repeat protein
MTEIALRTYNQEIKDLIEHGHFDEAIAHCQHILETFPRHIDTYRLLGKAFLEQGRHGDAADVFQRVLSAMPEDWLAHVAMAIVREDESNLDMAIWHMERAYEVNPSNPTVQQEVRRLRGRRDGVEPPKLRLTRSALARMYIKGGLYGQAIAEIRSALSEDPDRPDLQILLACALFDSGSIQEAADICSALLQKLPYCMEANRVLGLALLASEKSQDAEKLFQRMESLDPHIDVETLKKEKRIVEHPAQSIVLSRLEYEGQEKTVRTGKQPSWASSLGLKIEETPQRQAIPDWLSAASQQQPATSLYPSAAAPGAEVPSWINQAAAALGTSGAGGAVFSGAVENPPTETPAPIARTATGELPDWIQAQSAQAEPSREEKPSRPLPDWLSSTAKPPQSVPEAAPITGGGTVPDWIKTSSLPPEKPKETISGIPDWLSTPPPPSVDALPSSSLPEWTRPETKTGPLEVEPSNIPDWLNSSQPTSADLGPEPEWLKQPGVVASPTTESVPDWMKGVTPAEPPASIQVASEGVPDWLREPSAQTPKPVEIIPDWMRSESPTAPVSAAVSPIPQAARTDDIPEWMKPEPLDSSTSLPEVRAKTPEAQPLPTPVSAPPDITLPDWMSALSSEPAVPPKKPEPEAGIAEAVPESNMPDWLKGAAPVEAAPAAIPNAARPDWLNPPAASAPAPTLPTETPAASILETGLPDWLNPPAGSIPAPAAPMEAVPTAVPEGALPDWLNPPAASIPEPVDSFKSAPPLNLSSKPVAPVSGFESQQPIAPEGEIEPVPEIELPDWLKAVPAPAPTPSPTPAPTPSVIAESAAPPIADANFPDWLKGGPASAAQSPTPLRPVAEPAQAASPIKASLQPAPTTPEPPQPVAESIPPSERSEPGPAHVTPTGTNGIDLPEWLVSQLQGKPKDAGVAPVTDKSSEPLPDWLKPTGAATAAPSVVDWDKAASQPVPPAPVDATRPAVGLSASSEKPGAPSTEIPVWLDKSKPTGSDTVARWLDRRLKTSTLSSLDEAVVKGGAKPPTSPLGAGSGKGSKQLPTWLDTQKPGGSDTVVRWMDKRETGSLRKPVTASFAAVAKGATPPAESVPTPPVPVPSAPAIVPSPISGTEDTVSSKRTVPPSPPAPAPISVEPAIQPSPIPQPREPLIPARPPVSEPIRSPIEVAPPVKAAATAEDEEEGAFVPPPEWLQKALGSAVADVPPIPKKQTGGLTPGTAMPAMRPPLEQKPAALRSETPAVEEPAPAPATPTGSWVPIAPVQAAQAPKAEKPQKKSTRKKARKLTDVEIEALIREARVYLESDTQKASEAYQQVIDDPASADVVAGDLTTYLEQDPASPQLWNLLGDACSHAGRLQDAYRAYAEALRRM